MSMFLGKTKGLELTETAVKMLDLNTIRRDPALLKEGSDYIIDRTPDELLSIIEASPDLITLIVMRAVKDDLKGTVPLKNFFTQSDATKIERYDKVINRILPILLG